MKRSYITGILLTIALICMPVSNSFAQTDADNTAADEDVFSGFDEFQPTAAEDTGVYDPLIGYNRFMTQVNDKLYFWLLKPSAQVYSAFVKKPAREAISRAYRNILFPIRFVNNLLQLKFRRAGIETARFGINSTVGVAGLFDPAKAWWDLSAYPEDFGQTLGYYGVGSGIPIVIPVMGPSNLRDLAGMAPDYYLDPAFYFIDDTGTSVIITAHDQINSLSLNIGAYEQMKKDALDLYIFLRNAYEQNRNKKIRE